jgi:hypothetical protein
MSCPEFLHEAWTIYAALPWWALVLLTLAILWLYSVYLDRIGHHPEPIPLIGIEEGGDEP